MTLRTGLATLAALVVVALTRWPQLASPHLAPDGDECVLGLQALHLQQGHDIPVFFAGQRYGLSLVEAGMGAVAFSTLGFSTSALKIGQLGLWSAGVLFLVLSVRRVAGGPAAVAAAALAILCPAWGRWSLKASGGYVTAFVAAHALVWLVAGTVRGTPASRRRAAGVGVLAALAAWSQPLWLPAIAPFAVRFVRRRPGRAALGVAAAGALLVCVILASASVATTAYWQPPQVHAASLPGFLRALPDRLAVFLGGAFFFAEAAGSDRWIRAAGIAWTVALGATLALHFRPRAADPASELRADAASAVWLTLAAAAAVAGGPFFFRYFLPLAGFLVILLSLEPGRIPRTGRGRLAAAGAAGLLLVPSVGAFARLGTVSFFTFPTDRLLPENGATQRLVDDLEARGIRHVYCTDPLFQWNIMFASREHVLARWKDPRDRMPEYPRAVDAALAAGKRVAVVGDVREAARVTAALGRLDVTASRPRAVADLFYVLEDPPESVVRAMGFRPAPDGARP